MSTDKNSGKNKGHDNIIPFQIKKGQTLNPNGRPVGQKNYSTLYREALLKLAESNNLTTDELELQILQKGLSMARKGDYRFYKDVLDRTHGTAINKTDITTDGEKLPSTDLDALAKAMSAKLKQDKI